MECGPGRDQGFLFQLSRLLRVGMSAGWEFSQQGSLPVRATDSIWSPRTASAWSGATERAAVAALLWWPIHSPSLSKPGLRKAVGTKEERGWLAGCHQPCFLQGVHESERGTALDSFRLQVWLCWSDLGALACGDHTLGQSPLLTLSPVFTPGPTIPPMPSSFS